MFTAQQIILEMTVLHFCPVHLLEFDNFFQNGHEKGLQSDYSSQSLLISGQLEIDNIVNTSLFIYLFIYLFMSTLK